MSDGMTQRMSWDDDAPPTITLELVCHCGTSFELGVPGSIDAARAHVESHAGDDVELSEPTG